MSSKNKIKKLNVQAAKDEMDNFDKDNMPENEADEKQEQKVPEEKKGFFKKVADSKPVGFVKRHGIKIAAFILGTAVGVGVTAAYASNNGKEASNEDTSNGNKEPLQLGTGQSEELYLPEGTSSENDSEEVL